MADVSGQSGSSQQSGNQGETGQSTEQAYQTPKKKSLEEIYATNSSQQKSPQKPEARDVLSRASDAVENEVSNEIYGNDENESDSSGQNDGQEYEEGEDESQDELDLIDLKKHTEKIKYKGQEIEVDYDTLKKLATRGAAMEVSQQESAALRNNLQRYDNLFEDLKGNPQSFFQLAKFMGHDLQKISHDNILKELERGMLSPEQKELAELREWKESEEKKRLENEGKTRKEKEEQEANQVKFRVQDEVVEYFQSQTQKTTPQELALVFDIMIDGLKAGERLPIAKAHQIAQNRLNAERQAWLRNLTPEQYADLPPEFQKKFREQGLKNLSQRRTGNARTISRAQSSSPAHTSKKQISIDEYFDNISKKFS